MAGRMEQTAAHAGMQGAYPYSTVAGTPRYGAARSVQYPSGGAGQYAGAGQQGEDGGYGEGGGTPEPAVGSSPFPDEPAAPGGYAGDAGPDGGNDGLMAPPEG